MFDIGAPGQPALATVQVGQESRGLAVSPDGKYVIAGNYNPGGAVLCDAMTLEPLKAYDTSRVIDPDGEIGPSRVASLADTPYGPYFAMALKDVDIRTLLITLSLTSQSLEIFQILVKSCTIVS